MCGQVEMAHHCKLGRSALSSMLLVVSLLNLLVVPSVNTIQVHSIHWNSSNPIFRIDNTDNVFDVNQDNLPWEYDQLNIICPWYEPGTSRTDHHQHQEQYIIYNVSKEEYDTCRISQRDPRIVAVCNKPNNKLQFTITFRSFSPTPRGLEFYPGRDYYFISTSGPRDLYRRWGGACAQHNMKVIFKVAENQEDYTSAAKDDILLPHHQNKDGRGVHRTSINSPRQQPETADTESTSYVRPIEDVRSFHHAGIDRLSVSGSGSRGAYSGDDAGDEEEARRRRLSESRHAVKQEASTLSNSAAGSVRTLVLGTSYNIQSGVSIILALFSILFHRQFS